MSVLERESSFHDQWACGTPPGKVRVQAAFEAPTSPENRWILERLGPLAGVRILDVGTGLGEAAVYFALAGARVTATDLSPGMIESVGRLAAHHGVEIETVISDALRLQVPDAAFDVVYAANVMHHVGDHEAFFSELARCLRPRGRFFTIDPLAYNPVINCYRRMATEVRTEDENPLRFAVLKTARRHFRGVVHREFWLFSLALFLKYYLVDRVHPNQDRYWKRILDENPQRLHWWLALERIDRIACKLPGLRRLAWNIAISGHRP